MEACLLDLSKCSLVWNIYLFLTLGLACKAELVCNNAGTSKQRQGRHEKAKVYR
jgi:hypothetical protein